MQNIDTYIRQKKISLGEELSDRKLIYLDMNFWILLRKCYLDQAVSDESAMLYKLLKELVEKKKVLCPINHSVFTELLKQNDLQSRIDTAKVIDIFSNSVTLIFELERDNLELQFYVNEKLLYKRNLKPKQLLAWMKVPYSLGSAIPENDKIDPITQYEIQSKFFDYTWSITMEEMVRGYLRDRSLPFLSMTKTSNKLNTGKFAHQDDFRSLADLFNKELVGYLELFEDNCKEYFSYCKKEYPQVLQALEKEYSIKKPLDLCNRIKKDILGATILDYLPNIFINVCIHTLMRWNKERKFKANDLYDFQHARAALPYFDFFFTEKSLQHLVMDKPYELYKKYNCTVESDINIINDILYEMTQ